MQAGKSDMQSEVGAASVQSVCSQTDGAVCVRVHIHLILELVVAAVCAWLEVECTMLMVSYEYCGQ